MKRIGTTWTWLASSILVIGLGTVNPAGAVAAPGISLERVSKGVVVAGEVVRLAGTAPRGLAGDRLQLQRRSADSSRWVAVKGTTVGADGAYSVRATATGLGVTKWRVSNAARTAISNTVKTNVHQWFYLHDVEPVDSNNFDPESVLIGGKRYGRSMVNDRSFWYDEDTWAEWNIGYACVSLAADIGLTDESSTGSEVTFFSYADGAEVEHATKGLGAAEKISRGVKGILRLKLQSSYAAGPLGSGDTTGWGAWGNARVLCSAKPR